jgi:hypothetical protein
MNMDMQGQGKGSPKPGKGQGAGMQLPDIIKKQEGLGEKMKEGMKPGQQPGNKPGEGKQKGKESSGESGGENQAGENGSEGNAGKVLEILKEQRQLREALQKALEKEGMTNQGLDALQQMRDLEKQLINKGFKNETLQKMLQLKHELLKLEKAIQQQGEDTKRQSKANAQSYSNTAPPLSKELKDYINSVEILNRQSLPLHPNYNQKVQRYFKNHDQF